MKKTNRAIKADNRLKDLMLWMKLSYTTNSFLPYDHARTREHFGIGATYYGALKQLNAIETQRGSIKLTERFYTLRPSTVRKRMNEIVYKSLSSKPTAPTPEPAPSYEIKRDAIIAQIAELLKAL